MIRRILRFIPRWIVVISVFEYQDFTNCETGTEEYLILFTKFAFLLSSGKQTHTPEEFLKLIDADRLEGWSLEKKVK